MTKPVPGTFFAVFSLVLCLLAPGAAQAATAGEAPDLPTENSSIEVAAQEWPRNPGPRTVKVYVRYPGGQLAKVNAQTGLMLDLHNWGGADCTGTADPVQLANRFNVVAISVDYLQSGKHDPNDDTPYDFGYLQALDALRSLYAVFDGLKAQGIPFDSGRIYSTGGSGGGNVTLMVNKLAPRTFACAIDKCGMAKLSNDIAFNLPGGSRLDARYSPDSESPHHLNKDAQAIRWPGHPGHAKTMKALGNTCKLLVIHGVDDVACLVSDAQEMVNNLQAAGLDVEPHFITKDNVDGAAIKTTGHALGDRTKIVFKFADRYLKPGSPEALKRTGPTDFERREDIRYETPNGAYVISYENGYPVGRFESKPGFIF